MCVTYCVMCLNAVVLLSVDRHCVLFAVVVQIVSPTHAHTPLIIQPLYPPSSSTYQPLLLTHRHMTHPFVP